MAARTRGRLGAAAGRAGAGGLHGLLALHPAASGRVYAAYGGVYVATAIAWLWLVDGVRPTAWDVAGSAVALAGMAIIVWGWRQGG